MLGIRFVICLIVCAVIAHGLNFLAVGDWGGKIYIGGDMNVDV